MAKRELKVHYVPAGQKVWTICGMKVKPRVKGMEHPYTCGAAVVTCGRCAKAMKEMKAREDFNAEAVSRRVANQVVHVVHMGKEPEPGTSASAQALICGAEYTVGTRTDNARNCTCPDCLRMMADGWERKFGAADARAALYEKQAAEFKDFSQAAVTRADAAEQRADREKDIREAVDEIAVKALGNIKELEKKDADLSKALNDATVRFQYAEAQNSYLHGELESMKNERGVLREEVQRWKAVASVALALNSELFSCTTVR